MDSGPAFNVGRTGASLIPGPDASILNPGTFVCGCGHKPRSEQGEETPHARNRIQGIIRRTLLIPAYTYAGVCLSAT